MFFLSTSDRRKLFMQLPLSYFFAEVYLITIIILNALVERKSSSSALLFILLVGVMAALSITAEKKLLIAALTFISLMQVFYSLLNYSSTRIFLFLLLATVFFYIIKAFRFKYGDSLLKNILYVGVLHVILCFFYTFTHYNPFIPLLGIEAFSGDSTSSYRATGITAHPITGSVFSISIAIIALGFYNQSRNKRYLLLSTLSLVTTVLMQTRSVYVVMMCTLLILLAIKKHKKVSEIRIRIFPVLLFIFLAVIFFSISVSPNSYLYSMTFGRFSTLLDSGSFLQRSGSISFLLQYLSKKMTLATFLGNGFGSLAHYLNVNNIYFVSKDFFTVDNQYVTAFFEIGILGYMLFLILLSLILIPGFKTMHMSDISIVRMIGTPQAMCIALLFSVFFFECYDKPVVLCMLMLALAFCSSFREKYDMR